MLFYTSSGFSPTAACHMVARMRRTPMWLVFAGGAITVVGVLIQAFTIAACAVRATAPSMPTAASR